MGNLRKPFLVLALLVIIIVVLVETGSGLVLGGQDASTALTAMSAVSDKVGEAHGVTQPSGRGITYLALIDAVVLYTTGLFVLSLLVPKGVQGRVQGIVTLIGSIILILIALVLLIIAFVELLVMVTLFLAAPFGTIAYLVLWGFFPVGDAAALLALLLFLKLVFAALLILAQPRFLQNKGLVALLVTTLLCTVVLAFLHGFVPVILVSIVDDLGAVIFAIVAIIWGLVLLIGSIPAIWKAIRVTGALAKS
jgi:hypothetical protein